MNKLKFISNLNNLKNGSLIKRNLNLTQFQNATSSNTNQPSYYVFDRNTKKMQRNRIALQKDAGWLKEEIGGRVADRIFDIKRNFDTIIDLGCQRGYVSKHLSKVINVFSSYLAKKLDYTVFFCKKETVKKIYMLEMADKLLV
jgi:hypothetical protein